MRNHHHQRQGHLLLIVVAVVVEAFFSLVIMAKTAAGEGEVIVTIDPWVIPLDNKPYSKRMAAVGDTVSFHYSGNHNVYAWSTISNSGTFSCSNDDITANAKLIGDIGEKVATYTFQEQEQDGGGNSSSTEFITFFCNYSNHCYYGQQVEFHIYPRRDDIPPTPEPSTEPTLRPTWSGPSESPTVEYTLPPFVPLWDTTFSPTSSSSSLPILLLRSRFTILQSILAVLLLPIPFLLL